MSFADPGGAPVPKRVVIVDDSRTIRSLIRATLADDNRIVVVGGAGDPYEARNVIKALNPDVITLDVEMPRMNGLVFLKNLMRLRPMPVVMVSSRTRENSEDAISALSIGAVDCVHVARLQADPAQRARFADTIVAAASATVAQRRVQKCDTPVAARWPTGEYDWNRKTVLIGSSTGGVDALERVFEHYPADGPPTIVAQHMPRAFLESFAARLDTHIAPRVVLAEAGQMLSQGMIVLGHGGDTHVALDPARRNQVATPAATGDELYTPTVDILFRSALPVAQSVVGVVLTGMGRDGSAGLLDLRRAGARTIVQSGESSVIDGMPKAARENGAAEMVSPLRSIGRDILGLCSRSGAYGA